MLRKAVLVLQVVVQAVSVLQLLAAAGHAVTALQVSSIQSIGRKLGVNAIKWQSVQGTPFHGCLYVIGDCIVWLRGVGCVFIVIRVNPRKSHAGSFTV